MAQFFMLKLLDGEGFNVLYKAALIFRPVGRSIHVKCVEALFHGTKEFLTSFQILTYWSYMANKVRHTYKLSTTNSNHFILDSL